MLDPSGGSHEYDRWKQFGFLIADLFLVLALLFLLLTISGQAQVNALKQQVAQLEGTPTVTATVVRSPTPLPQLTTRPVVVELTVDAGGLLAGSKSAAASVINQIKSNRSLKGQRAGLVIAYGGTPDQVSIGLGEAVAGKVDSILKTLSGRGQIFEGTAYHDPLFVLGQAQSYVKLEVYLYKKQ